MNIQRKKLLWFIFILFYTALYYIWIIKWQNHEAILTLGGNFLSLLGCLLASVWLWSATLQSKNSEKTFWLLLLLGTLSIFAAELLWFIYENIIKITVPFPGLPDLLYLSQIIFYLAALIYKLVNGKKMYYSMKFIFDILIVMTVSSTFSWHFLIRPIVAEGGISLFSLVIATAYPLGDLALLLGLISLYSHNKMDRENKIISYLFLGFLIQIYADSSYLYLTSIDAYSSGSLIDPLFMLAILCIGYTGLLKNEENRLLSTTEIKVKKSGALRLILPYLIVTILFVFMTYHTTGADVVTLGSAISIFLVIIRQIIIIFENNQLLQQLQNKKEQLELSEQRYKSLFDNHPDAVYSLDLQGRFESVNDACANLLGLEKESLIGLTGTSFILDEDKEKAHEHIQKIMDGQPRSYDVSLRSNVGKINHISMTNIPIVVQGELEGFYGIAKDITANKRNEEKIQFLAYHDALTGLANRRLFDDSLQEATIDATVQSEPFAIMFIDLDNFKRINDTLGHDVGDKLLVSISKRLRGFINEDTIVARNGGDEFTLLLKGISNKNEVIQTAEKIINTLAKPHIINGRNITSSPSIGIALFPIDDLTPTGLLNKADLAMYQVKSEGKGQYKFYSE